jgi:hypothetical protein
MADEIPMTPQTPPAPQTSSDLGAGSTINIGDEFGTAKRNLPPAKIVAIVLAALVVAAGMFAFTQRAKPQGQGSLDFVSVADMPDGKSIMVAATVTLQNSGQKPLWIHAIGGTLVRADGKEVKDTAASAVDFDRYFQALPTLEEHATEALLPETKLMPGEHRKGTVVVSFPVTQVDFNQKKSFKVVIQPYDQPVPIELGQ